MKLSSLNVDVLFHLIKFVDPVDRFNLVLSGILKGFENANKGIDLSQRIEGFEIELWPCRDSTCHLEIRSLKDETSSFERKKESRMTTLERLADGGFFQNTRQMMVVWCWPSVPRFSRVLRSTTRLEKLSLLEWNLTLTQDLPQLLRSCPKLTKIHLKLYESQNLEMNEDLRNELRSGFQRFRIVELKLDIHSWPIIQEIFTWLKECAQLTVRNNSWMATKINDSLTLNSDLARNLQYLHLVLFPVEFVKWVLPFCPNIHTLKLDLIEEPNDLHSDIARLKTLKDLLIKTSVANHPKEIIRNCRQVEILRVCAFITLRDLTDLEHYENLKEADLRWLHDTSVKEALPILVRCKNIRRISLEIWELETILPPLEELRDFIMELKHLTFLHIIFDNGPKCDHFKSEVDGVNEFVLPRRPNFEFYVSCCFKFNEHRVPKKELVYF